MGESSVSYNVMNEYPLEMTLENGKTEKFKTGFEMFQWYNRMKTPVAKKATVKKEEKPKKKKTLVRKKKNGNGALPPSTPNTAD